MTRVGNVRHGFALAVFLMITHFCLGQHITETSVPLGDALTHALEKSLLTSPGADPFHVKVHLFESTNPTSPYKAEIEEYWVSPQEWRRTIDSPSFKQTLIVNGQDISEQNVGDYYPLWLKTFITGIFDMVPNVDQWSKIKTSINQITMPDGRRSTSCARITLRIGNENVKNDNFANVCFDGSGLLNFAGWPGYGMEFHDYQAFGHKKVAQLYQDNPEPGTTLVAKIATLEKITPDATMFSVTQATPVAKRLRSIYVSQSVIDKLATGQPQPVWPQVVDGKTSGLLTIYISIDHQGQVQEAYPLNSDNAQLDDEVRAEVLKWKLKPILVDGSPVQAESALTFHFDTTLKGKSQPSTPSPTVTSNSTTMGAPVIHVSPGVSQGLLMEKTEPAYPEDAKERHVQGKVVLALSIDKTGTTKNIHALTSPDPELTDAAITAVSKWKYRPYLLNGSPVEIESSVELDFSLK